MDIQEIINSMPKIYEPGPNDQHIKKLGEMVSNMSSEEATHIACILAEKHPESMFIALNNRMNTLTEVLSDIRKGVRNV